MTRSGNTTARGYGHTHQLLHAQWEPRVATGTIRCWRCGELIDPTPIISKRTGKLMPSWHVGHDDHDRTITRGPEHSSKCNLATSGRRGADITNSTIREW